MEDRQEQLQRISNKLRIVFRFMQAHSKKIEAMCGLSNAKLTMLSELSLQPGLRVSELAKVLSIHVSTCSNMLDHLEKHELIRRDRDKGDQRAVRLYATEAGERLLDKAPPPVNNKLSDAITQLEGDEQIYFESGLDKIIDSIQAAPLSVAQFAGQLVDMEDIVSDN